MRPETARTRLLLLAVLSVGALVLAACGPAQEPPADSAGPAPAADVSADEEAVEDAVETEAAETPGSDAEPIAKSAAEEPAEDFELTAYVVAYHWGFAIFEEDGTELEQLRVREGTTVELVAVNDHASAAIGQLPEPVVEAIASISWHERAHHDMEMGRIPDPETEAGASLSEVLAAAHDGHDRMDPVQDHGLVVTGVGARAFLDAHAREPERLVFTVDREGTFEFRCNEDCGFGHDYQRWELLVVEA